MFRAGAISVAAHMCLAHVKAAVAAGHNQNKVRAALDIAPLGDGEAED